MQVCKKCYTPMVGVMSFSKDKNERFCRCPKCRGETKHQRIINNDFEAMLDNELHKRK